jgi:hypothetical protein
VRVSHLAILEQSLPRFTVTKTCPYSLVFLCVLRIHLRPGAGTEMG